MSPEHTPGDGHASQTPADGRVHEVRVHGEVRPFGEERLPEVPMRAGDERPGWFFQRGNVRKLLIGLYLLAALALVADLLYHPHYHSAVEERFGQFAFYSYAGLLSCILLILGAKVLRQLVGRPEDHHE